MRDIEMKPRWSGSKLKAATTLHETISVAYCCICKISIATVPLNAR